MWDFNYLIDDRMIDIDNGSLPGKDFGCENNEIDNRK
jgi:hypothetical protein